MLVERLACILCLGPSLKDINLYTSENSFNVMGTTEEALDDFACLRNSAILKNRDRAISTFTQTTTTFKFVTIHIGVFDEVPTKLVPSKTVLPPLVPTTMCDSPLILHRFYILCNRSSPVKRMRGTFAHLRGHTHASLLVES